MSNQLEKTKCEALDIWNRAKLDDQQRINKISEEQRRLEEESRAREEILRRSDEERQARDKARRDELRRQEELLSGRKIRSKTADLSVDDVRHGCIFFPKILMFTLIAFSQRIVFYLILNYFWFVIKPNI